MSKLTPGRSFWIFFCFLFPTILSSQQLGLRRPAIAWQQINTDTARIIFPKGLEQVGMRAAEVLHHMARTYPVTDGKELQKIDIVLQNATDISNAYVGYGPFRSEFYLTPPQNNFLLGSLSWVDLLTIHEYRHVQQLSASRRGISKLLYYLFGEEAYSGTVKLSVPDWYLEGDAVVAETVLTPQGRGRLPSFLNGYRDKLLNDGAWDYQVARNQSFRELVPSHYPLGYLLCNYGRMKYGQTFWDSVLIDGAAYRSLFYPFSSAMRKKTGTGSQQFYTMAMDYYRDLWSKPMDQLNSYPVEARLNGLQAEKHYYSFRVPRITEEGRLLAVAERFDAVDGIYHFDKDGNAKKIVSLGRNSDITFSARGGLLCWAELRPHPRWVREDYSVLILYDEKNARRKQLTRFSSYFMPSLNGDASQVVALFDDDQQAFALHVLSTLDGSVIRRLPNPQNLYLSYPVWSRDASAIFAAARDSTGRMAVVRQSVETGRIESLTEFSYDPIGRIAPTPDRVYFSKNADGQDQVHYYDLRSSRVGRLTTSPTGAYEPAIAPDGSKLVFSEYHISGNRLRELSLGNLQNDVTRSSGSGAHQPFLSRQDGNILDSIPDRNFNIRKYPKLRAPVNVHSWRITADDPTYGFEIKSENILSTVSLIGGFRYNRNDESYGPFADLRFGFWFPELVLGYSGRQRELVREDNTFRWFQHTGSAGVRVPLNWNSGLFNQQLVMSSRVNRTTTSGDVDFTFSFLSHALFLSNQHLRAYQYPMSRFAQTFALSFAHSIDTVRSGQFQLQTDFTFPSPLRNQLLWLQFDIKDEPLSNDLRLGDNFNYPRGYTAFLNDQIYRVGVNYHFPLWYPDSGIGGIVYFKRIRFNPFLDYSKASIEGRKEIFRSVGFEVLFDLELFNVETWEFGIRWSRLLNQDQIEPDRDQFFEFFLPIQRF